MRLGGDRPWDIRLRDASVPARVLALGSLGLGEAYMDGHWECDRIDQLFDRLLRARLDKEVRSWSTFVHHLRAKLFNLQTARRAWQVGREHYDLGNDFYAAMLDQRMTYTCAFWEGCRTLDEAQEHKLDMVCRKLGLEPGMNVLDIGCGWGSFMQFAAVRYGVHCTGVTISTQQASFVQERCAGLPVQVHLTDYCDVEGRFDRIVSLGMFEHVGHKNHDTYMRVAERCLADDGLFLLHTIGGNEFSRGTALMAWHANVQAAWPRFADKLGQRFRRMWHYYLLSCAGAFRARDLQLWQWVLSKPGRPGVYQRL